MSCSATKRPSSLKSAFGEVVVEKELAQIFAVHLIGHTRCVRVPGHQIVDRLRLAHEIFVNGARPDEVVGTYEAERAGHLVRFERALLPHHVFEQRELAVVDEEPHLARFLEIPLRSEERQRSQALVMVARHAGSGDHSQGAADTVADQMGMGGACNGERRVDRGHHALATVVVEVDVAVFRGRIAPGNTENGETCVDEMPNQRILGPKVEDIVLHDPCRDDDDRFGPHRRRGRSVLNDFGNASPLDHRAFRNGDCLPGFERLFLFAAFPPELATEIGGVIHRAPHKVGSAFVDGLLQCDGIGRKRIGGRDRVEGLAPEEFDHVQVVARRAVDLGGGFVPPVFRSKESIDIERIRPMTPFLGAKPRISRTLLGRPIVSALCGRKRRLGQESRLLGERA